MLKVDGAYVPNPLVVTDRWLDAQGRICHGRRKAGAELEAAKALRARGTIDLAPLDEAVERVRHEVAAHLPGLPRPRRSRRCAATSSTSGTAIAKATGSGWRRT